MRNKPRHRLHTSLRKSKKISARNRTPPRRGSMRRRRGKRWPHSMVNISFAAPRLRHLKARCLPVTSSSLLSTASRRRALGIIRPPTRRSNRSGKIRPRVVYFWSKASFPSHEHAVIRCLFPLGEGTSLKAFLIILLLCVSGCSWFHRKPHAPDPTDLVVVGAPVGATVFVDGVPAGQAKEVAKQPQEVEVSPGTHIVEVRIGDTVAYRENTYVTPGEKHVISVLSGRN